jgi:hypothetical protein
VSSFLNAGAAAISVAAGSYTDAAGNAGGAGITPPLSYDTLAPTLAISSSASTLKTGETATITFSFSEVPSGFSAADITTSGGSLSGLAVSSDPKVYTATFTPTSGSSGTAVTFRKDVTPRPPIRRPSQIVAPLLIFDLLMAC